MDGPLRSTRQGRGFAIGSGGNNNGQNRGGRHHNNHRGGRSNHRGGRSRNSPWRGGGGRHQNRHRTPQEPKNRTIIKHNNTSNQPNTLENQLRCMIAKMTISSNGVRADIAQNIKDLSNLLSEQQDTFGEMKLYEYILDCVVNLPNYQEAYATLTIVLERDCNAFNQRKRDEEGDDDAAKEVVEKVDIIGKCVREACKRMMSDLVVIQSGSKECTREYIRCKFLLRYLALLSHAGVVQALKEENDDMAMEESSKEKMTFYRFMQYLVSLVTAHAEEEAARPQSILLCLLIMETIPYMLYILPHEELTSLVSTLETQIIQTYKSGYKPTKGMYAVLLSQEMNEEDDEEEEEEEEPCSDILQDVLRNLKTLVEREASEEEGYYQEFILISSNMLWKELLAVEGEEEGFSYNAIPLELDTTNMDIEQVDIVRCPNPYSGIIYGRFPIFSSTADDDEEEEEEEEMKTEEAKALNPYVEHYTTLDKYFLHSSIRDICICYTPQISPSGSTTGDISDVMDQIQSLKQFFTPDKHHGIEYGICECLFGLILQSQLGTDVHTPLNFIYLSRVMLQYVKTSPMTIPQIVVSGVSTILEDLLPSMSPPASTTLSMWLGFHLVNTDYQWPTALWEYWMQHYMTGDSVQGLFVRNVIQVMIRFSDHETVVDHLNNIPVDFDPTLKNGEDGAMEEEEDEIQIELYNKMMTSKEDSANIATWLCSFDTPPPSLPIDSHWRSALVLSTIIQKNKSTNILLLSEVQATMERYIPLLTLMMEKDTDESSSDQDHISTQQSILTILFRSFGSSSTLYSSSIQSLITALQIGNLITPKGLFTFVLNNEKCLSYWWMIVKRYLQVLLEESATTSLVSTQGEDTAENHDDKTTMLSESIQCLIDTFVNSLLQTQYNVNDYALVSKLEGFKYVIRHLQRDAYEHMVARDNTNDKGITMECFGMDKSMDGLLASNGDNEVVVSALEGLVHCWKDGRSTGYIW